jgi:hypothetical protein
LLVVAVVRSIYLVAQVQVVIEILLLVKLQGVAHLPKRL